MLNEDKKIYKEKDKPLEDAFLDPLRESTLITSLTSGTSSIIGAKIAKETKLDLPRFKVSKEIEKIFDKKKSEAKNKKGDKSKDPILD
jgi:hypothetical protein